MRVTSAGGAYSPAPTETQGQKPNNTNSAGGTPAARRDTVSLTKSAKVKRLQQQKKSLSQRRERLIRSTVQKGESLGSIKTKLMQYEQKIKQLQEQIALAAAKDAKAQMEKSLQNKNNGKVQAEAELKQLAKGEGELTGQTLTRGVMSTKAKAQNEAMVLAEKIREKERQNAPDSELAAKRAELEKLLKKVKNQP